MTSSCPRALLRIAVATTVLVSFAQTGSADPIATPCSIKQLQHLSLCELAELYTNADVGTPFVGDARGKLLASTDRHPKLKVIASNSLWKGKSAEEDGHFVNRWLGGIRAIDSQYVVGPSWVDGKPSVIMEYSPGTKFFANTHDELREIAPGLYLGPVYDRCPCPKLRGYFALQLECCGQKR
jgi:hypothetical protein